MFSRCGPKKAGGEGTEQGLFFCEKGSWQPFAWRSGEKLQVSLCPDATALWAGTDQGLVSSVNRAPGG
jgi:hypothetical protein